MFIPTLPVELDWVTRPGGGFLLVMVWGRPSMALNLLTYAIPGASFPLEVDLAYWCFDATGPEFVLTEFCEV